MAIKGKNEFETVSVYDPSVGAYREISFDDYKQMLESLGLSEVEVQQKLNEKLTPIKEKLKKIGVPEEKIKELLKL